MEPVDPDDYEDLLNTIYYLKEVRDRQYEIDEMWEPIKVKLSFSHSRLVVTIVAIIFSVNRC